MAKLNKNELLEGVRNIIEESFNRDVKSLDCSTKFNIHRYVNGLIEEGHKNPELMTYLLRYDSALNNGAKDFLLFEQFGQGLAQYAKGNKSVKAVIEKMNDTLATDGAALVGLQLIERIQDAYLRDTVSEAFNRYVDDKCAETRDALIEALEPMLMASDPIAMKLNLLITEDSSMSANFIHTDYVNESDAQRLADKLQAQRDKKTMDQIFTKVQRYIDEQLENDEKLKLTEKDAYCLDAIANKQGLELSEHINSIRHSDASSNERLMEVLNLYSNAINQGAYEERLYETFLQNISKFNYLLPVEKVMKSITEKVDEKREEITLTKILEEMKDDHVSFIYVEHIQEDVARYVKEPSAINRVQLRNALMPYASDPYINEMFNIIYADNTRRSNELSEKALNIKDQINIIRQNATVSNIYTPVQYVCENESIFNVNGQFYVKKGNNIAVLDEKYIDQLDERFVELCQLVNDPHVEINEDNIVLSGHDKYATIFEGYVDIYGHKESKESLRNLREMCMKYDDYDTNFYIMCSCLLENFNNIAKVDWAKHVTLNENNNISADLFKLDQNIFIATHNDAISQHTFYRNVNPIFCKNKLNEHMGINVSSLFSDLLPSQDKIILKLNETKNAYEDSIEQYEEMIDKLKAALDNASEENKKKLEDAIEDATSKLEDVKTEYKEWQKQADAATGVNSDDEEDDTVTEKPNEPMSDDEVEDVKDELSQPLESTEDDDAENTDTFADDENDESAEISDDEFQSYLGDENDTESEDTDVYDEEPIETDDTEEPVETEMIGDEESDDIQDEEAFKEVSFDNDEITDDDVFVNDANAESTESEEGESDEVESEETPADAATSIFGGDTEDPLNTAAEPVEIPDNAPKTVEDKANDAYQSEFSYKIANVMFDENVKENKKEKSGQVIVIVPMVDGTGKKYVENKTIKFYIDDTNTPILDNDPMTNELYAAVIDAIKSHPDYTVICETAEPANEQEGPTIAALKADADEDEDWEAAYLRDGNEEDRGEYSTEETSEDDDDNWVSQFTSETPIAEEPETTEVPTEDETDDVPMFKFDTDDEESEDEDEETEDIVIPSYKSGDTEIELPAATADDTVIPESKEVKSDKSALKESLKITPVFKKTSAKKSFFVNEATIKASEKKVQEVAPLTEEIIDGSNTNEILEPETIENNPIENYNEETDNDVLLRLHDKASKSSTVVPDDNDVVVSDINDFEGIKYFIISNYDGNTEHGYVVYQFGADIYYRDVQEFMQLVQDYKDGVGDITLDVFTHEYAKVTEPLTCYSIQNVDDCMFIISAIFSSLVGNPCDVVAESLNENCKIRRSTKIDTDNDINNSKLANDAKYGTEEDNKFKQEVEDKQKADGTIGALDPQQEENASYKPALPNVNLISEGAEIEYEVNDKVIFDGKTWHVFSASGIVGGKQTLRLTCAGQVIDVDSSKVKPDPEQLKDIENTPDQFEFDKNNLNKSPQNEKPTKMADLNGPTVECNIVVDSHIVSGAMSASVKDLLEGEDQIRVYTDGDDGYTETTYNRENVMVTPENWPFAVIADTDGKPLRSIQINPTSFIEAKEDTDLVDCLVGGKETQLPKHCISIITK